MRPCTRVRPCFAVPRLRAAVLAGSGVVAILSAAPAALAAPPQPALTTPRLNEQIGAASLRVSWRAVRGALSYVLRIREYNAGSWLVNQTLTGSSFNFLIKGSGVEGGRIQVYVYACSNANGTDCSDASQTSAWVLGPPVVLSQPGNGASYTGSDRRPSFSWQAYTGFRPSASMGPITYSITFAGNGAGPQSFTTSSTTYTPPQAINPAFQNPVRWSVRACNSYNCSGTAGTRTLNLTAGSTFPTIQGPVNPVFPANGAAVDAGSQLRWSRVTNAAHYKVCLNTQPNGCLAIYDHAAQSGNVQSFTLTQQILDAKPPFGQPYFRGRTVYWSINACTQNFTACTAQNSQPVWRSVQVAAAQPGGGGGGTPQVSFAQHLYPTIASSACGSCHPGGSNPPYYPQKPNNATNCGPNTIPFSTAISAAEMLNRFTCLTASSTQSVYDQAYGKVYVVPGQSSQSGLHYKAQASSAGIFGSNVTIGGVTKQLREWITIWIDQGANP